MAGFNSAAGPDDGGGGGAEGRGVQGRTLMMPLSSTAEMQTLLARENVMNLVALCLSEVSWTTLIEALNRPIGLGGLTRPIGLC